MLLQALSLDTSRDGEDVDTGHDAVQELGIKRHQDPFRSDHLERFPGPLWTVRCSLSQTSCSHRLDLGLEISFHGRKNMRERIDP